MFWLLAAIDGHAKNFSVFLTPGGFRLTPLYDVMSVAPYPQYAPQKVKPAMAVGNQKHYRLKTILPRHFYQTAQQAGIAKQDMDELFADILTRMIPPPRTRRRGPARPGCRDAVQDGGRHLCGHPQPFRTDRYLSHRHGDAAAPQSEEERDGLPVLWLIECFDACQAT